MMHRNWTPHRVAKLRRIHSLGLTYAEIARHFPQFQPKAVETKLYRLDLYRPSRIQTMQLDDIDATPYVGKAKANYIIAWVACRHQVKVQDILSASRTTTFYTARYEAMWRIKKMLGYSYPRIGRIFNMSHATAIRAVKFVQHCTDAGGVWPIKNRNLVYGPFNPRPPKKLWINCAEKPNAIASRENRDHSIRVTS